MNQNDSSPLAVPASNETPQNSEEYSDNPEKIAELRKWMADAKPENFHHWLLPAARRCRQNGVSVEGAFKLLRERANENPRPVSNDEITRDIRMAYDAPKDSVPTFHREPSRYKATPRLTMEEKAFVLQTSRHWPKCPPADFHKFIDQSHNVLREFPDLPSAQILEVLYGNFRGMGYHLVFGKMIGDATSHEVVSLDEVLETGTVPEGHPLVVPNLATKTSGYTAYGKPSTRSRTMFPERHYLVVESDIGEDEMETQFALIHFTASFFERDPTLVMHSGNKSLHSWWRVDGLSEKQINNYFKITAPAIDRSTLATNQLVRVPNSHRQMTGSNPGRRQVALYLDPHNVAMPPGVERPWAIEDRPLIFRSTQDHSSPESSDHVKPIVHQPFKYVKGESAPTFTSVGNTRHNTFLLGIDRSLNENGWTVLEDESCEGILKVHLRHEDGRDVNVDLSFSPSGEHTATNSSDLSKSECEALHTIIEGTNKRRNS